MIAKWYRDIFDNSLRRYQYQLRYSKHFNLGLRRVTKNHVAWATYFLQNIESLSNQDYFCIRYEDLCETPEAKVSQILDFLAVKPKVTLDYESLIEPRPIKLLPEIKKNRAQICQTLKPYLINRGYQV